MHNPWLMLSLLLMLNRQPHHSLYRTSIFQVRLTSAFHRLSEPASIIGNVVNADGGVAASIELADENNDVFDTVQTNATAMSTAAPLHQGSP